MFEWAFRRRQARPCSWPAQLPPERKNANRAQLTGDSAAMNAPYRSIETAAPRLTTYRPFIDGLRAISVLAVVLYHVGVPGISGGYVGVDIFFVISGFLIISQIIESLQSGKFSFSEFWARRALRILPPYFLVLAACIAAAPFVLMLPEAFADFAKQLAYAAVMVVNHFFLSQQGYFDGASDTKVLLHLWSLAVEEQFYLLAPFLLAGTWWLAGRLRPAMPRMWALAWLGSIVFVISLVFCVYFTTPYGGGQNYAFFLAPLRAWEFAAGGAVGFLLPAALRLPRVAIELLAAAGLAAILAAVFMFTTETRYPYVNAVLPVFGAVGVLLAGLTDRNAVFTRVLANRGMVWIGLLSYSWYLWHWPLLAFLRIMQFGERHFWIDACAGAVSLGLAAATYYLLERPIREWRQARRKRFGWGPAIAGVLACGILSIGGLYSFEGLGKRVAASTPPEYLPAVAPAVPFCDLGGAGSGQACNSLAAGRQIALLIGDSHAVSLRNGLATFAAGNGTVVASLASGGCISLVGVKVITSDARMWGDCENARANALRVLGDGSMKPSQAVLFSRWPIYGKGNYSLAPAGASQPAEDQGALFVEELRTTIVYVRSLGVQRIVVVGPLPLFPRPVPNCLFLAARYHLDRAQTCGVTSAVADAARQASAKRILAAIDGFADVRYVDPFGDFCDASRCLPYSSDSILFTDTNHLSDAGAARMIAGHQVDFHWLAAGNQP
jgi:peptidoglycan/LPS O-acetylase OafA/YrhL